MRGCDMRFLRGKLGGKEEVKLTDAETKKETTDELV